MSRRANINSIRLGVSTYWNHRSSKIENQEFIHGLIKKFRINFADVIFSRSLLNRPNKIVLLMGGTEMKEEIVVYVSQWIKEYYSRYKREPTKISIREIVNLALHSKAILGKIVNNQTSSLTNNINKIAKLKFNETKNFPYR
jgi:hypothetical protein